MGNCRSNDLQGYEWIPSSRGRAPSHGVVGGYDGGEPMYVGRAYHNGAIIPGKIHPSHKCCYIACGTAEHFSRRYEVLCRTLRGQPIWLRAEGSQLPPGAIKGGRTEDGEPLYIGRHMHERCLVPGKVQKSSSCLYISWGGHAHSYRDYEVLVSDPESAYEIPPN